MSLYRLGGEASSWSFATTAFHLAIARNPLQLKISVSLMRALSESETKTRRLSPGS